MTAGARANLFRALLLAAITISAHFPATRAAFVWDDGLYIRGNATIRDPDGLRKIWFEPLSMPQCYPLTWTTFWIEWRLFGPNPVGYHVVNIGLHTAVALLLWTILRRLRVPGAWFAAALFAVHPIEVESVALAVERKNLLSAVFFALSLLAYLRFLRIGAGETAPDQDGASPAAAAPRTRAAYGASLAFFVLALLSKTVTGTLPVVLLLIIWWKRGRVRAADLVHVVPFFAAAIAMGIATAWIETHHIGAQGAHWALGLADRIVIAGRAWWFYLAKLAYPESLSLIYPRWRVDGGFWPWGLAALAAAALVAGLWAARNRIGRGPFAAAAFYSITLAPALGFFDVYAFRYSFVADHFQYIAGIAPITLAAAGAALGVAGLRPNAAVATRTLAAGLLFFLAWRTQLECGKYAGEEALWSDTLAKNPNAAVAHTGLGRALLRKGDAAGAAAHFERSVALGERDAAAYTNWASSLAAQGRTEEAIAKYRDALREDENLPVALRSLAWILATHQDARVRDGREAVALAERAGRVAGTRDAAAFDVLAAAYAEAGRFPEAVASAREGLRLARRMGREELAAGIEERLGLFAAGRPYRSPEEAAP